MTKTSFAEGQLKSLIERIERLEEERKTIAADIKEIYAEAKANGFDTTIMRKVVSLRKKEPAERAEEEAMLDVYLSALGMQPSLFEEEIPEKDVLVVHNKSSYDNVLTQDVSPKVAVSSIPNIPSNSEDLQTGKNPQPATAEGAPPPCVEQPAPSVPIHDTAASGTSGGIGGCLTNENETGERVAGSDLGINRNSPGPADQSDPGPIPPALVRRKPTAAECMGAG